MEDFGVFIDLVCVRVGTLETFYDNDFDVYLSYRECDFENDKSHSHIKNYRVCDFYKVEVGKSYRFVIQSIDDTGNYIVELLDEV